MKRFDRPEAPVTALLALSAFPVLTCLLMALARAEESLTHDTEHPRPVTPR